VGELPLIPPPVETSGYNESNLLKQVMGAAEGKSLKTLDEKLV